MSELPAHHSEVPQRSEGAPFSYKLAEWKQADYEHQLHAMGEIPCLNELEWQAVTKARNALDSYYHAHHPDLWIEEMIVFHPQHIIARYDGKPWNYGFHEQARVDHDKQTPRGIKGEQESNIIGIAKKMVQVTTRLVRQANKDLKDSPQDRTSIETQLVSDAEDVFESIFPKQGDGGVYVKELLGPRGPVYLTTRDGNHRLAAARMIQLKQVRGNVERIVDEETAKTYWYDMLAALSPRNRTNVLSIYHELYPSTTTELQEEEMREVQVALERRPTILLEIERIQREKTRESEEQNKVSERIREATMARYERTGRLFEQLTSPEFRRFLYKRALTYLKSHTYGDIVKNVDRVDEAGWMYAGDQPMTGHVLGIDLDEYPKQTKKEIIALAIEEWERTHPTSASE